MGSDSSVCEDSRLPALLTCLHSDSRGHHQQRYQATTSRTQQLPGVADEVPEVAAPPSCREAVWDTGDGTAGRGSGRSRPCPAGPGSFLAPPPQAPKDQGVVLGSKSAWGQGPVFGRKNVTPPPGTPMLSRHRVYPFACGDIKRHCTIILYPVT